MKGARGATRRVPSDSRVRQPQKAGRHRCRGLPQRPLLDRLGLTRLTRSAWDWLQGFKEETPGSVSGPPSEVSSSLRSADSGLKLSRRRLQTWWLDQQQSLQESLQRMLRTPLATLMTVATIAVALSLPTGLFVAVQNLERLAGHWERSAALSVFLDVRIQEPEAARIATDLRQRADILSVTLVTREQGLEEFRRHSGLGEAIDQLSSNPLPLVLAVEPAVTDAKALASLAAALEALPQAALTRQDSAWIQRFGALVGLLESLLWVLSGALALVVILVVGNSIRLEISNRREEAEIMDLVGATHAYIRRPFLYSGAWFGFLGALLASLMVWITVLLLQLPVSRLAETYGTRFALVGPELESLVLLWIGGVVIGTLGSALALASHLRTMRPV